jgi:hypothetical protein
MRSTVFYGKVRPRPVNLKTLEIPDRETGIKIPERTII